MQYLRVAVKKAVRQYFYDNFVDALYSLLGLFTYVYLGLAILTFFFQKNVPATFPYIVDTLSEPYLGALGMYVIVKEIARSRGKYIRRRWGENFVTVWTLFFIAASMVTYFSEVYYFDEVYKVITTNALAALIIRIGAFLK